MTIVYADAADLAAYTGAAAPDNADVLLREASRLVGDAIRATVYVADDAGIPVDSEQSAVLTEATCAQAAAWAANNVNPLAGRASVSQKIAAKSGGGVSVTYVVDSQAAQEHSDLVSGDVLSSKAISVLKLGGMLSNNVQGSR